MARFIHGMVAKYNLMKQPMVVVNKAGGAGADGVPRREGAKGDPHKIVITLSNLFTTRSRRASRSTGRTSRRCR